MSKPRRRRRVICEFDADDQQAEAVFDAVLHVADIVDPGQVDVTMGPASEALHIDADNGL